MWHKIQSTVDKHRNTFKNKLCCSVRLFLSSVDHKSSVCSPDDMLPQASKELLARMRFFCKPLFQGRYLLLTNTVTCGGMLALGDHLQQSWEIYKDPNRVRNWKRTGEKCFSKYCYQGDCLCYCHFHKCALNHA